MSAGGGAAISRMPGNICSKTAKKKNWNGEVDVLRVGGLCLNGSYHVIYGRLLRIISNRMIEGMEVLTKPQVNQNGTYAPEKPGGGKYWWILFFIAAGIIVASRVIKENPALKIEVPGDRELFDKLPDHAKKAFTEKYGQPDDDDRECELYYLIARSTMKRPCVKCPVWCMDPEKIQILVSKGQIYYIGKTCQKQGKRKKEHQKIIDALDLDYKGIKRGTEGYITTQEQLHLKTYFTRSEAIKEGCRLFLPPGNSVGVSQRDWRKLLKELR
ncbi:MAG: hypothetical protein J5I98_17835 [Phaeodactylibacter sp.]|nr:hypothetical protein [Phaeodactylibacter sp.]